MIGDETLNYRSADEHKNTLLHEAILRADKGSAITIIEADMKNNAQTIINVYSQCVRNESGKIVASRQETNENTALILAIKLGLIDIALKILDHPKVNVNLKDARGLTALHWAAALRQDVLIRKLLSRGADPSMVTPLWFHEDMLGSQELHLLEFSGISALGVYKKNVNSANFLEYYYHACILNKSAFTIDDIEGFCSLHPNYAKTFFFFDEQKYQYIYKPAFIDNADLNIPGEIMFTDLMFHMGEMCTNMGWINPNQTFRKLGVDTHRTVDLFAYNFAIGMQYFCKNRNAIPINPEIVNLLTPVLNSQLSQSPAQLIQSLGSPICARASAQINQQVNISKNELSAKADANIPGSRIQQSP